MVVVVVVRWEVGPRGIDVIGGIGSRLCSVLLVQKRVLINSAARYLACLGRRLENQAIASLLGIFMSPRFMIMNPNPQQWAPRGLE
jgi:hypothetical protein